LTNITPRFHKSVSQCSRRVLTQQRLYIRLILCY